MMNQYKKETAQVHAPKALIEKTKAAVREEEARIQRVQAGRIPTPQVTYADYAAYQKKHSWRKWSYPLTAAAAVVILLSVSLAIRGVRTDSFTGDQEALDGAMLTGEAPAADAEAGEMNGAAADSVAEETESAAGAVTEAAPEEMENTGGAMTEASQEKMESSESAAEAPAADFVEEDTQRDMARDDSAEKKEMKPFRSAKGGYVEIEAVEEKPDFYDNAEAEDIVYEGLTFRVMEKQKGWTAYVETADGTAYVINGTFEELDIFLREGYEELEKTEESHE